MQNADVGYSRKSKNKGLRRMARAPADEPDSKLSDSTRGFNSLSALASTAREGSQQTIQGHARPGLKMTSCLNVFCTDGRYGVFVVQHLPQPGRSSTKHGQADLAFGGVRKHGMGILAPKRWPTKKAKRRFAMHRLPADGPGRSVGMAGHVLEMGKSAPQSCAAKSCGWNGTAQRRYRQERRGEASRLCTSPSGFWAFICASVAASGKGGKETRVGATPWRSLGPCPSQGTYPLPREPVPFTHGWCPCFFPPFPPRPNVTLLRVPVA